ncbi:hypothetical protein [Pseudomonas sp. Q2-TVG4-2]|uniref:hypothetical protein n=1 Tax=Pseudomonas sp. Q2-TVG4-2 TaxID=1685699 RepID=UPI0015E64E5D|nr:hypothetical protein [Pseudomonas sp. Q2-TVG4-2]
MTDFEDLILETETRGGYGLGRMLKELAAYLAIPIRYVYPKPRYANGDSFGCQGMQAADAAALLIALEDLGFAVNPERLIARLAKPLAKKEYLTDSEVCLYSYEQQRHRKKVTLRSDIAVGPHAWSEEYFKGANGYRFKLTKVEGKAYRLDITGPKHRNIKPRQEVTCDYCRMTYTKGNLESSIAHRREHARLKRLLEPRPDRRFANRLERHSNPELVDSDSPFWMHQEVYERALRFKRDFRYDFLQWNGCQSKKASPNYHGYLFADHTGTHASGTIVGACAFALRKEVWSLDWIWVVPSMRRKGVLRHRWQAFLKMYGDFDIEHPLSTAMEGFVGQHGTPQQRSHLAAVPQRADDEPIF